MGRQDNDPTVVNSSIALLQERFRQLEKVKERREGKELLKLISDTQKSSSSSTMHYQQSASSMQPRVAVPHKPTFHDSLSLGLNISNKQADHSAINTPPTSNLWAEGASTSNMPRNFEHTDVDTSLHL